MRPKELIIAVFASGKGSNCQAILDAIAGGRLRNSRIALVISNNPSAGVLMIARNHSIPAVHFSRRQFPTDEAFNDALLRLLADHRVNFIVLAGYMKRVDRRIVSAFRNQIVNIHPALLPAYGGPGMYGESVHRAVLEAHERESGATVHIVDEEYDHGPIVLQERVPVRADDTPESLAARIHAAEHRIFPEALRLFAEGKVTIDGQHVTILE